MNNEWIVFHLKEAKEELDRTIGDIQSGSDYGCGEFVVAMGHLYHHLNTAWNSRDATPSVVDNHTDEDFTRWRQFPQAEELMLDASHDDG